MSNYDILGEILAGKGKKKAAPAKEVGTAPAKFDVKKNMPLLIGVGVIVALFVIKKVKKS